MPGSECVSQEGATVLHQATEGDLSIPDQLLLRLTGTAGVLLRTDLKVLTWAEETGRDSGQRGGILGFSLHLPPVSGGWSFSSTCLAAFFFVRPFSPTLPEPSFTVPRPPQFTPICHRIIYLTAASRAKLVTRVSSGDSSQHGRRHASKDEWDVLQGLMGRPRGEEWGL